MKYATILFVSEHNADELMDFLDQNGPAMTIDMMAQRYDHGDDLPGDEHPAGSRDYTHEHNGYLLVWNTGLPYIGLSRIIQE